MTTTNITFTVPATIKVTRFSDGSEAAYVAAKTDDAKDKVNHIIRVDAGTLAIIAKNAGAGSQVTVPATIHGEARIPDSQATRLQAEVNWPEATIKMAPAWMRGEARIIVKDTAKAPEANGTDAQDAAEAANS